MHQTPLLEMFVLYPVQQGVIEAVEKLIKNFKIICADLNAAINERNEVDIQMKNASSEFLIKEIEEAYLDCNRTVTMLRRKKLGFHSDLNDLVYQICQKHIDEITGLNMIKQKLAEQYRERQLKRKVAEELAVQPPLKKNADEKVVPDRRIIPINTETEPIIQQIVEEKSEHKAHDDVVNVNAPPPEPQAHVDEILLPSPSTSKEVSIPSASKHVVDSSKQVSEEGEIP